TELTSCRNSVAIISATVFAIQSPTGRIIARPFRTTHGCSADATAIAACAACYPHSRSRDGFLSADRSRGAFRARTHFVFAHEHQPLGTPATLFQVPADYTVQDKTPGVFGGSRASCLNRGQEDYVS